MKKILLCLTLLTLALAVLSPGPAAAFPPMAWLQVGSDPVQVLKNWVEYGDGWYLNFTVQSSEYTVSGNVATFEDPYLSYGVAFNNNSAKALPFKLGILDPIIPIDSPATVYASYSGSGTDVSGDGYSITPLYPDLDADGIAEIQVTLLNDAVSAGVDVGQGHTFGPGTPGHSNDLGTYSSGPMTGPLGWPWNSLGTNLWFNLSGNDIATLNGYSSVVASPVPEPASLMFLGMGLIGMGFVVRRKRR